MQPQFLLLPVCFIILCHFLGLCLSLSVCLSDEGVLVSVYDRSQCVLDAISRIRSEIKGGAWCPKQQIQRDVYEFLQVDLGRIHVVSLIETQGRFGNGQVQSLILFIIVFSHVSLIPKKRRIVRELVRHIALNMLIFCIVFNSLKLLLSWYLFIYLFYSLHDIGMMLWK